MNIPGHVAIIMDGNGRWGIKKKKSRNFGHKKGLEVVEKIIETAIDGSKQEIVYSIKKIIKKKIPINEKNISQNLYTMNIPDPEILIRTGDVNRISNFLIWQISYTEIFFVKKMWPDFNKVDFLKIIKKFNKIKRNFGGLDVKP